jgi:hypothetical protein
MTHTAFDVYLYGKLLERVYYTAGHTAEAVRHRLIAEESYPPGIVVHLAARATA